MTVILQEFALSYLPVPKIACTSLKTFFYEIENGHQPFGVLFDQWPQVVDP